ncbi:iron-siderophore ABC transporter substrate-binding protein [Serinicoccus profundi]|uniref:iron-siderophore ABC transporter substrate-binding protein n=1 Tax=Serinicoccus profundi TaxID=1078471 RepID=UPI000255E32E|nr:iron-siderophore ABC transporter substrate-binding protein [Serinicoccus profundi]
MSTSRTTSVGLALTTALVLAACGGGASTGEGEDTEAGSAAPEADAGAFPVTVSHAFGETTIEEQPERVATVAWSNHEVPLALGVVPVGMSEAAWGDDDGDGVLPWVEDRLTELDAETPVLFDEADGIDFEAVADTEPDVILAAYSGLTQEEYDTLSQIAPVVAYPETAWNTSMADMISLNSQALGLAEEGEQLNAELEQQIADAAAEHPELEGTNAMFAYLDPNDLSQVGFYTTADPRAMFLEQLGTGVPTTVEEISGSSEAFYETVSAEESDSFDDVELIVTYGTEETLEAIQDDPLLSAIPAVENGAVVVLEDNTPLAASTNPSPLSIEWGLSDYLGLLDDAVAQAQ